MRGALISVGTSAEYTRGERGELLFTTCTNAISDFSLLLQRSDSVDPTLCGQRFPSYGIH